MKNSDKTSNLNKSSYSRTVKELGFSERKNNYNPYNPELSYFKFISLRKPSLN